MGTQNLDHFHPTKTRIFTLATLHIPAFLGVWLFHTVDDWTEAKSPSGHVNTKICYLLEGP